MLSALRQLTEESICVPCVYISLSYLNSSKASVKAQIVKFFLVSAAKNQNFSHNVNPQILQEFSRISVAVAPQTQFTLDVADSLFNSLLIELYKENSSNFNIFSFFCLHYILLSSESALIQWNCVVSLFALLVKAENELVYERLIQKSQFFQQILALHEKNKSENNILAQLLSLLLILVVKCGWKQAAPTAELEMMMKTGENSLNLHFVHSFLYFCGNSSDAELNYTQLVLKQANYSDLLFKSFLSINFSTSNSPTIHSLSLYVQIFLLLIRSNPSNQSVLMQMERFIPQSIAAIRFVIENFPNDQDDLFDNTLSNLFQLLDGIVNGNLMVTKANRTSPTTTQAKTCKINEDEEEDTENSNFLVIQLIQQVIQLILDLLKASRSKSLQQRFALVEIFLHSLIRLQSVELCPASYSEAQEIFRKLQGFSRIEAEITGFCKDSPSPADSIEIVLLYFELILNASYNNGNSREFLLQQSVEAVQHLYLKLFSVNQYPTAQSKQLIQMLFRISINSIQPLKDQIHTATASLAVLYPNYFTAAAKLFYFHILSQSATNFEFTLAITQLLTALARYSAENRQVIAEQTDLIELILTHFKSFLLFESVNTDLTTEFYVLLRILFTCKINKATQLLFMNLLQENSNNERFMMKIIELIQFSSQNGRLWSHLLLRNWPSSPPAKSDETKKPLTKAAKPKHVAARKNMVSFPLTKQTDINYNAIESYAIQFGISIDTIALNTNTAYPLGSLRSNSNLNLKFSLYNNHLMLAIQDKVRPTQSSRHVFNEFKFVSSRWYYISLIFTPNYSSTFLYNFILAVNGKIQQLMPVRPVTFDQIFNSTSSDAALINFGVEKEVASEWQFRLNHASLCSINTGNKAAVDAFITRNHQEYNTISTCSVKSTVDYNFKLINKITPLTQLYSILSNSINKQANLTLPTIKPVHSADSSNSVDPLLSYSTALCTVELQFVGSVQVVELFGLSKLIALNLDFNSIEEYLKQAKTIHELHLILLFFSSLMINSAAELLFRPEYYCLIYQTVFSSTQFSHLGSTLAELILSHCGLVEATPENCFIPNSAALSGLVDTLDSLFDQNSPAENNQFVNELFSGILSAISSNRNVAARRCNLLELRNVGLFQYLAIDSNSLSARRVYLNFISTALSSFSLADLAQEIEIFKQFALLHGDSGVETSTIITPFDSFQPVLVLIRQKVDQSKSISGLSNTINRLLDPSWLLLLLKTLNFGANQEISADQAENLVESQCFLLNFVNFLSVRSLKWRETLRNSPDFFIKLQLLLSQSRIPLVAAQFQRILFEISHLMLGIPANPEFPFAASLEKTISTLSSMSSNENISSLDYLVEKINKLPTDWPILYGFFAVLFNFMQNHRENSHFTAVSSDFLIFTFNFFNSSLAFRNFCVENSEDGKNWGCALNSTVISLLKLSINSVLPPELLIMPTETAPIMPNFGFAGLETPQHSQFSEEKDHRLPVSVQFNVNSAQNSAICLDLPAFPTLLSGISLRLLCQMVFHALQTVENNAAQPKSNNFALNLLNYCVNARYFPGVVRKNYISVLLRYVTLRILHRIELWTQQFVENAVIQGNLLFLIENLLYYGENYSICYANYDNLQLIIALLRSNQFKSLLEYSIQQNNKLLSEKASNGGVFGLFSSLFTGSKAKLQLFNVLITNLQQNIVAIMALQLNYSDSAAQLTYLNQFLAQNSEIFLLNDSNHELLLLYVPILLLQLLNSEHYSAENDLMAELLRNSAYKNLKLLYSKYVNVLNKQFIGETSPVLAKNFELLNNSSVEIYFEHLLVNSNQIIVEMKQEPLYATTISKLEATLQKLQLNSEIAKKEIDQHYLLIKAANQKLLGNLAEFGPIGGSNISVEEFIAQGFIMKSAADSNHHGDNHDNITARIHEGDLP
jgi:hypothetical protein